MSALKPPAGAKRVRRASSVSLVGPGRPRPLGDAAYHGIAGRFVRTVEPESEADPAALLIQFLVAAGSAIGRGPYVKRESARHGVNEFAVIVGESSKARKGTSLGYVTEVVLRADPEWTKTTGLSSGEGVIHHVRDPIEKKEAIRERKSSRVTSYQMVEVDPGVPDERLLIVESELASALKVARREGNTLSATLRQAWDSGELRVLTKNSPERATDAHISIIGHITQQELRRHLDDTEAANGFANRFVWVSARRSKELPFGGSPDRDALEEIVSSLKVVIETASRMGRLDLDAHARTLWASVYGKLSAGRPGLLGAVTGRAEAHVTRFGALYAVLDLAREIGVQHLWAALEVWRYCEESAGYIFGDSTGDPIADRIYVALVSSPGGLTRSEVSGLFSGNQRAERIESALRLLVEEGRAHCVQERGRGRPAERWLAGRQGHEGKEVNKEARGALGDASFCSFSSCADGAAEPPPAQIQPTPAHPTPTRPTSRRV